MKTTHPYNKWLLVTRDYALLFGLILTFYTSVFADSPPVEQWVKRGKPKSFQEKGEMKSRALIILILLMSAFGETSPFGGAGTAKAVAEPIYEYCNSVNGNAWIVSRNSQTIQDPNVVLAVNVPRTQSVTSVGTAVPLIGTRHTEPWSVDHVNYSPNDALLCMYGSSHVLEYTTDLTNYATICDLVSTTATSDSQTIWSYGGVQRMIVDGSTWYLSAGNYNRAYSAGTYTGALFKSTDKGSTWTNILKTEHGMLFFNVVNDKIIAGEYHQAGNDDPNGRDIYLSENAGATFQKIYDYEPYTIGISNHFHCGYYLDSNTVYVAYGDGKNSKVWKLTRPVNWTAPAVYGVNNWTKTELRRFGGTDTFAYYDGKLYFVNGSEETHSTEDILTINMATDAISGSLFLSTEQSSAYTPYAGLSHTSFGLRSEGGLLFASFMNFGAVCPEGGLAVSADGQNWTVLFRNPAVWGVKILCGTMTINGTKYIIGQYLEPASVITTIAVPVANIRLNTAVCVQKGFTNNLARINADFANDQWTSTDSSYYDGATTQDSGLVGYGFKYTAKNNSKSPPGYYKAIVSLNDIYEFAGHYPVTNDYISFGFYYKASPLFSSPAYDSALYTDWDISGNGGLWTNANDRFFIPHTTDWRPFMWYNKCADGNNRTSTLNMKVRTQATDTYRSDLSTIFDRLCLIYSADRWFENPASLVADCTGGTLVVGTVADEYVVLPSAVESKAWTLTFDWYPQSGFKSYPYSASYPTLPIASILGTAGSYIDLNWSRQYNKLRLSDIDSDVNLTPPTAAINWRHADCLHIAITCNGTDSNMYVWGPENYSVNGAANGVLNVSATGIGLANIPIAFRLGTDHSESNIGAGSYANIRIFNSVLSATDVNTVFNTISAMKRMPADIDIDGDVDFTDYAVWAPHWVEQNCTEPDWCAGTDFDHNGQVDVFDLAVLCDNWLAGK